MKSHVQICNLAVKLNEVDVPFYISELLYKHDCVILPGFGGFVTQYEPAKIHPINHTFLPPSKNIMFNSKLTRNDGLLIDFIAGQEGISYKEAREKVADFISSLTEKIDNQAKAGLKNIGIFKKSKEGTLLFHPADNVNYYDDSFGLTSFVSPPILRKPAHKRLEKKFTDRKPVPVKDDNKTKRIYWTVIAVIPVLIVVGWLIFFNFGNKNNQLQQSGMVTLSDESSGKTATHDNSELTSPPIKALDFKEKNLNKTPDTKQPEEIKPPAPRKMYYIIGGAFSNEDNAEKLVGILRNKGYEAERAGLSKSGLHMVSYLVTPDKNEALLNLAIIRKDDNPSAWLIRK